jgi:hypothetical protein
MHQQPTAPSGAAAPPPPLENAGGPPAVTARRVVADHSVYARAGSVVLDGRRLHPEIAWELASALHDAAGAANRQAT